MRWTKACCTTGWLAKRCNRPVHLRKNTRSRPRLTWFWFICGKFQSVNDFDDLLEANAQFAQNFGLAGFDGVAHAGIAVVTCMDSRLDPLGMLGLKPGDAKIFRNPGGRVTEAALEALVLGVHLLNVKRIVVAPHTKCAMSSSTLDEIRHKVSESAGQDAWWQTFSMVDDQEAALRDDIHKVTSHPLIPDSVKVGGFLYDVDTGLLKQLV